MGKVMVIYYLARKCGFRFLHIKNIVIHKTGITMFFEFYNIAICENYFCSDNNIMSYGFSGLVSRTIYPLPCTLGSGMSFGMIVI